NALRSHNQHHPQHYDHNSHYRHHHPHHSLHHHDHHHHHHHHDHDHHHHHHHDDHHDPGGVRQQRDLQHRHRPAAVLLGSGLQPRVRRRRRRQDEHERVGRDQDHHDSRPLHGRSRHHPGAG